MASAVLFRTSPVFYHGVYHGALLCGGVLLTRALRVWPSSYKIMEGKGRGRSLWCEGWGGGGRPAGGTVVGSAVDSVVVLT